MCGCKVAEEFDGAIAGNARVDRQDRDEQPKGVAAIIRSGNIQVIGRGVGELLPGSSSTFLCGQGPKPFP